MRTTILILPFLLCAAAVPDVVELTPGERQRLVAHLEMTSSWLLDEVSNLSQTQLDFRRAPDSWTILEVFEHLVVVGPIYWNDLQKAMQAPPSARGNPSADANILWYGIDRTHREKAIPPENPKGQLRELRPGLDAYRKQHAQLLDYVKSTKEDLRSHTVERQACDAYQWALLISTHEQRHILQIREIKADPKFPRK
jgi:hypothetical protein